MWLDRHGEPARLTIKLQNALNVRLHARCGKDPARRDLDFLAQLVVVQRPVSFEDHPVDDRVFHNADDQVRPGLFEGRIGKQSRRKQSFERQINALGIKRIARLDEEVGLNRAVLDTLITLDQDGPNGFAGLYILCVCGWC